MSLDDVTADRSLVNWKGIHSAGSGFRMRSDQDSLVVGNGLSLVEGTNRAEISSYEWRNVEKGTYSTCTPVPFDNSANR